MILSAPSDRLLLTSRRVALPEGPRLVVEPAAVLVEGGRIAAVWPLEAEPNGVDALAVRAGARLIDEGDRLITPAFINAHTHLALSALRGSVTAQSTQGNLVEDVFFRLERAMNKDDIRAFARLGAYESLLSGVALVWDHYYAADAVAEALLEVGLSGVVAPTLQDLDGPGADRWEADFQLTEKLAADGSLTAQGVFTCFGPHATDTVSSQLWSQISEAARNLNLPVHAHLAQSVEEVQRAYERHQCSPVEYLRRLGVLETVPRGIWAHGIFASKQDLGYLRPEHHALVFCPYSQVVFGLPARADQWSTLGLNWAVATDCSASNDSMNVQKELRFVESQPSAIASNSAPYLEFLETGALEAAEAAWDCRQALLVNHGPDRSSKLLSRVWRVPGAFHTQFMAGEIAAGHLANFVVWDAEHPSMWPPETGLHTLVRGDTTGAIHAMYVMGRQVGQGGAFHRSLVESQGYRRALAEANDCRCRLIDQI